MDLSIEKFKDYVDDEFSLEQLEALADVINDRLVILKTAVDKANYKPIKGFGMEEAYIYESLRDWFKKEKWVRISTSGNIAGPCGTSKNKKNPDRCLPRAKAQSLTKAQRAATARKKKKAGAKGKTVVKNTKKATVRKETKGAPAGHYFTASGNLVKGRLTKAAKEKGARLSDPKDKQRSKVPPVTQYNETADPQDGKAAPYGSGYKPVKELTKEDVKNLIVGTIAELKNENTITEKDDRCTRIAKRKYDTWPSAYASGAVVRCRRGEIWKGQK